MKKLGWIGVMSLFVWVVSAYSNALGEEPSHYHSVKGIDERLEKIEKRMEQGKAGQWMDKVTLSGLIEVAISSETTDHDNPATPDPDSSDITLSTVELGVDVEVAKHVKGHILFLWEEDDTEDVIVDEGIIIIDGADVIPLYLEVGKMYIPFGNFESHFISDPITLDLGETRESALRVGYINNRVDLSMGTFNGDIQETDDEDDNIDGFFISAVLSMPEDTISGINLTAGISFISNIADSDGLSEEIVTTVEDYVSGLCAFLNVTYNDKFFLSLEHLGATDDFEAGELSFDGGADYQPSAWNFEFAYAATDRLELALKVEGGDDLGDFQVEKQYGVAALYSLFENTSLAGEYLQGEYDNDDERESLTAQVAIEF